MYPSRAFNSTLLLSVIPNLVFSSPLAPTLARRQDTVIANFQLLGPDADCFNFSFDGNTFSATCVSVEGTPAFSRIDLDACITNDNGNMVYRFNPQTQGGNAFSSCSDCTLNSNTLDLTCSNCATISEGFHLSTINLDGTTADNGHGVFIRDNGKLSCRAPIAA
ncbi:hypothetical protein BU23DRAFT_52105 [Bimuria novae-zelandiae CBS 107.79]|uniref:Cyanovirin-N domain-containing protein n=1 Tax=Bimuria novae-zelandiae CBS 107.79 TaxID=1447943 RepID=A0A6A5ULE7_9PLEO|nr:hypothetical protein BU23DRAFT_52105 [Bimuria novae-zelandiae CBS 107.79]